MLKDLPLSARQAYQTARRRAFARGLAFISEEQFEELWSEAGGRCQLSGLEFSDDAEISDPSSGYSRPMSYPWQPSIDQIQPGLGYNKENVQIICKAVNIGKNAYSNEVFERWVTAVAKHMGGI